jgi:hypothetical protein
VNTILNWANRQRSGAYPWEFRDLYVHHYHTHYEHALANGEGTMFGCGSTESENRYANVMLAASAIPSQRLHFVDPGGRRREGFGLHLRSQYAPRRIQRRDR